MTIWNIDGMVLFPLINYATQMLDKDPSLFNNVQIYIYITAGTE